MSNFHGHPIKMPPPGSPASIVYKVLDELNQAKSPWRDLVTDIAKGYTEAWDQQQTFLKHVEAELQQDIDRQNFILSIFCAGIAGGLLGGLMGGAFKTTAQITKSLAKELDVAAVKAENFKDIVSRMGDDAASQFGGTALSYFQSSLASSAFDSPGTDPKEMALTMQNNVDIFLRGTEESIGRVVKDLESGKLPASSASSWYQYFSSLWFIETFPDRSDISKKFKNEASLCLWIAWGAERQLTYWNNAWTAVEQSLSSSVQISDFLPGHGGTWPLSMVSSSVDDKSQKYEQTVSYYEDILRWDPLLDEIRAISPSLVPYVLRFAPGISLSGVRDKLKRGRSGILYAGMHLDVLKLKDLGLYSGLESAYAMSQYFKVHKMAMEPKTAREILDSSFGPGGELNGNPGRKLLSAGPAPRKVLNAGPQRKPVNAGR